MKPIYDSQQNQPLYVQVAEQIKAAIEQGIYPSGSKLPSENQLVEEIGVSRVTVRKALQRIAELGYTYSEKGKGTFVKASKLKHDFLSMSGFAQEAAGAGLKAHNLVKEFAVITADQSLAARLEIEIGEEVNYAARVRFIDDQAVSYEEFYIPRSLLPSLKQSDLAGSKFDYLSKHDIHMVKTQQKLVPTLAQPKIQQLLDVASQEPILVNESINYRTENDIYEYSVVYYKSSVYDFEITARI